MSRTINEPNTKWPAEKNWKCLEIPYDQEWKKKVVYKYTYHWYHGIQVKTTIKFVRELIYTTYSTALYCRDMCNWVKGYIQNNHHGSLGHTKTIVNLYSYRDYWEDNSWKIVARNSNLDLLGIDIYTDQVGGMFAVGVPAKMKKIAQKYNKDWWLVETAGADNPDWGRYPSTWWIKRWSNHCLDNDAAVLGYYRLWGDYGWPWQFAKAYNIYTNPGDNPTARKDRWGVKYWETIRDI